MFRTLHASSCLRPRTGVLIQTDARRSQISKMPLRTVRRRPDLPCNAQPLLLTTHLAMVRPIWTTLQNPDDEVHHLLAIVLSNSPSALVLSLTTPPTNCLVSSFPASGDYAWQWLTIALRGAGREGTTSSYKHLYWLRLALVGCLQFFSLIPLRSFILDYYLRLLSCFGPDRPDWGRCGCCDLVTVTAAACRPMADREKVLRHFVLRNVAAVLCKDSRWSKYFLTRIMINYPCCRMLFVVFRQSW